MKRKRTDGARVASWSACGAVVLTLLAVPVAHAASRINECNSDITISQTPAAAPVGQMAQVTLTISSTDSRDNMDNPVPQIFDKATYTGDCTQPPALPCVPDPMATVMFQGLVGGTCPGVVANPMGNGVVEFDFVPDLSLLIPAPATPISCTVIFNVSYTAADFYAIEAMTQGFCQNALGSNSQTEVQTIVQAVGVPELTVMKACAGVADPVTGDFPYTVTLENTGTETLNNCFLTDPGAVCGPLTQTTLAPTEMATATCTSPDLTNTVTATCDVGMGPQQIVRVSEPAMCVPTLGELGLIALAVLLGFGAWRILRRRDALTPI